MRLDNSSQDLEGLDPIYFLTFESLLRVIGSHFIDFLAEF